MGKSASGWTPEAGRVGQRAQAGKAGVPATHANFALSCRPHFIGTSERMWRAGDLVVMQGGGASFVRVGAGLSI